MGPTEAAIVARYAEIRRRIAHPRKVAIVVADTGSKLVGRIKDRTCFEGAPSTRYALDEARVKELFDRKVSYSEIAEICNVPLKPLREFLKRRGWRRKK
jgi:hypothetical protein